MADKSPMMAIKSPEMTIKSSNDDAPTDNPVRVALALAFGWFRDAGPSQVAHDLAERERGRRGVDERIEPVTGGTDPTERVHEVVVDVVAEIGLSDRTPRAITPGGLATREAVITTGSPAEDACPSTWRGDGRDRDLDESHGNELDESCDVRDETEVRVGASFDEPEVGARV